MSLAALSTPFFTTDQNGSAAVPWVPTSMRVSPRASLPAPAPPPVSFSTQPARAISDTANNANHLPVLFTSLPLHLVVLAGTPGFCARPRMVHRQHGARHRT